MTRIRLRFSGARGDLVSTTPLFPMPAFWQSFDISPDGKTFVITRSLEMKKFDPPSLVVHWKGLIR
jgi:hypothetical protein